jgi:AraC-like DNA-binding protein
VRLLGRGPAEERGAMDYRVDTAHCGGERVRGEQIAFDEFHPNCPQVGSARRIAHQGAHVVATLGKTPAESASDFSGRSGDEDLLHLPNVALGSPSGLEETDTCAQKLAGRRSGHQTAWMHAGAVHANPIAPSAATARAVAALFVHECVRDMQGILIPRPETNLVVRFGPSARSGLDAHAVGVRQSVHRKVIRAGQRTVTVRLLLGAQEAVLGVPAPELADRIIPLEELWGETATQRLLERLAHARGTLDAAAVMDSAIAERLAIADSRRASLPLALDAIGRLTSATVNAVAVDLGVSERHLRRLFRDAVGLSPKAFAKLARFQRALRAAREDNRASWASIAAAPGYYDQAHLIADFRGISGATPRALLSELTGTP